MAEQSVAVVTGASRGIGHAIAIKLSRAGYFVVGTATGAEGIQKIEAALATEKAAGVGLALNLSALDSIDAFAEKLSADYGAPAVLVNNAGITRDRLLLRMKPQDWHDVITTNLTATYRLTKALIKGMLKARFGRIVNISSVVARMGSPGQSNYVASKAGLEGFTRAIALELAGRNITVNAVAPGFIETDMTAALSADQRATILNMVPVGRLGEAAEVAELVAFLCGNKAGYITGESIQINGGLRLN